MRWAGGEEDLGKEQSTQDAGHDVHANSNVFPLTLLGHPHSHQQVPFACVALHVASCVDWALVKVGPDLGGLNTVLCIAGRTFCWDRQLLSRERPTRLDQPRGRRTLQTQSTRQ